MGERAQRDFHASWGQGELAVQPVLSLSFSDSCRFSHDERSADAIKRIHHLAPLTWEKRGATSTREQERLGRLTETGVPSTMHPRSAVDRRGGIPVAEFETLLYREEDGVAWVTLNRPEVHNAFNRAMQTELAGLWTDLRTRDEVRCVVLTAAGEQAFCTGIDRNDIEPGVRAGRPFDALGYEDPRHRLGPKTRGLWKPVVAAVNGMACGGAFYMLGESDIIIAAENATFFDPHLTYGMAAVYEPLLMMPRMLFGELM